MNFSLIKWSLQLALLRMQSSWRSRLIIIASVLLATSIGALSPLYTSLVAQVGMVQRLNLQSHEDVSINAQIGLSSFPSNLDAMWSELNQAINQVAHTHFDPINDTWLSDVAALAESSSMFVIRDGEDVPNLKLRAAYSEEWDEVTSQIPPSERADVSAVIPYALAEYFNFTVGDIIALDQRGWASSRPFTVEITAILPATNDPQLQTSTASEANIFVSRDDLLDILESYIPQAHITLGWQVQFNHHALANEKSIQAVEQITLFKNELERILNEQGLALTFSTNLPTILSTYATEINLLNAPFGVLMLQVAVLVLFFLMITVTLAQRSERAEIALLQNRGAQNTQIMLFRFFEGVLICGVSVIIAPFISLQLLIWFAPTLVNAYQLTLELTSAPFIYAGAMGILALVVLLITVRPILKAPLISAGGKATRGAKQSWWQRYYLDLLFVVIGSAALLRLLATDSPFTQSLRGGLNADPLLLVAPSLLFIALGSITLRLFAPMTELTAKSLTRKRGIEPVLASWSVSRDSAHYARLTFLLALAIGIGWFAISFYATITRSYIDQSLYQVGADIRLSSSTLPPEITANSTNIQATTATLRIPNLNLSLDGSRIRTGQLLGIEADTFAQTAYWRNDLGELLLPSTPILPDVGTALPHDARSLSVQLRLTDVRLHPQTGERLITTPLIQSFIENFTVFARVYTEEGNYLHLPLIPVAIDGVEDLDNAVAIEHDQPQNTLEGISGWINFKAQLNPEIDSPIHLDMLYWRSNSRDTWSTSPQYLLEISELYAFAEADEALTTNLLANSTWTLTPDNAAQVNIHQFENTTISDEVGYSVTWSQRQPRIDIALTLYPPPPPIPVIINTTLAEENALAIGATFNLHIDSRPYTFIVTGTTDYFPMLYAEQAPFVIADRDTLLYALNQRPTTTYSPNEMLITFLDKSQIGTWLDANDEIRSMNILSADEVHQLLTADVLTLGLSRLLIVIFTISLTLSVMSLLAYAVLNAQSRREQFAVLRALGMSSEKIATSIAFEQLIIFGFATILGMLMGMILSGQVLPTLAINADGRRITPPFWIEVDSITLLLYGAILLGILIFVLIFTAVAIRQMSLSQALRYRGE